MMMFLALHSMEFIFLNSLDLLEHLTMLQTSRSEVCDCGIFWSYLFTFQHSKCTCNSTLVINFQQRNLLNNAIRIINLKKSKLYRRYYNLISKFHVGLKSFLRLGLSEPVFYSDLVYKLKKCVDSNNCKRTSVI